MDVTILRFYRAACCAAGKKTTGKFEMSAALLLIDLQVDFLAADGRMPIAAPQVEELLEAARTAAAEARRHGWPVVAIGNEFPRWNVLVNLVQRFAALKGSAGAAWDARAPQERDAYFAKWLPSAFTNPELDAWLRRRGVTTVHLAGVMAGACVASTARGALKRGYAVKLIAKGIGSPSEGSRERALERLRKAGCTESELGKAEGGIPSDRYPA
jgi:nicotinamidase-related amidase